jgi:hypothetical protein
MKVIIFLFILFYDNLCFSGEGVDLHLISYLDNSSGDFIIIDSWNKGTFLVTLGVELNINKAKVIYIEDLNANELFCLKPYPYYQLTYLRSSKVFDRGNIMVMVPRPCVDTNLIARLKLVVLDENKKIYSNTLKFNINLDYDVH